MRQKHKQQEEKAGRRPTGAMHNNQTDECRLQKDQVRLIRVGQTITVEGKRQRGQCEARQGNQRKDYNGGILLLIQVMKGTEHLSKG